MSQPAGVSCFSHKSNLIMDVRIQGGIAGAAIKEALQETLALVQYVAEATGIDISSKAQALEAAIDNINKVCEASEVKEVELPLKLARKIKNREAWDMAVREGYVTMGDDGKLQWQLGTKTLLAYFLGRVFCGDRGKWSKRRGCYVWEQGEGEFPEKDIERLFGKSNVRIIRENQRKCNLPKMHQIVDKLFDTLNLSNI